MATGIYTGNSTMLTDVTPDGLVRHQDPALEQQLLDEPQAEREAEVEPHGIGDEPGREAVPFVNW